MPTMVPLPQKYRPVTTFSTGRRKSIRPRSNVMEKLPRCKLRSLTVSTRCRSNSSFSIACNRNSASLAFATEGERKAQIRLEKHLRKIKSHARKKAGVGRFTRTPERERPVKGLLILSRLIRRSCSWQPERAMLGESDEDEYDH